MRGEGGVVTLGQVKVKVVVVVPGTERGYISLRAR